VKRQAKKARAVKQTRFDHWLIQLESLASEFSDLLDQPSADHERLWAIRLRELPEAVRSLEWAMKKAQMKALPLEGGQ
jgi:hypothetical protein